MAYKFNPFTGTFDNVTNSNGPLGRVQLSDGAGSFVSTSNLFFNTTNNRLGIGTSAPDSPFSIRAAAPNANLFTVKSSVDTLLFALLSNGLDGDAFFALFKDTENTPNQVDIVLNTNGDSYLLSSNLGLGTAAPGAKLHVVGTAIISNTLDMNGTKITNLDTPTATTDAANKSYVDTNFVPNTEKGAALGVATLDGGGKVPLTQLPSAIMTYEGVWNAATNTPALADGGPTFDTGMVYRVSVAGTQDLGSGPIAFAVGDYAIYNPAGVWEKSDTTDAVASVNGYTGVVTLNAADVSAANVTLSNLGTTAVNANITPNSDQSYYLGDEGFGWSRVYTSAIRASDTSPRVAVLAGRLQSSDEALSVDWEARRLLNPSGTTLLDWSGAALNFSGFQATNLADPTLAQNAATKNYVDTTTANNTLSNLGTTAINANLVPDTDDNYYLGDDGFAWDRAYMGSIRFSSSSPRIIVRVGRLQASDATVAVDWEARHLQNISGDILLNWSGTNLDANAREVENLLDPTLAQSAATKAYVDNTTQVKLTVVNVAANVTLAANTIVLVDTAAARTLTLPSGTASGTIIEVKDATGSGDSNAITLSPASGTIDGAATATITSSYGSARLVTDGVNWFVI